MLKRKTKRNIREWLEISLLFFQVQEQGAKAVVWWCVVLGFVIGLVKALNGDGSNLMSLLAQLRSYLLAGSALPLGR